MKPAPSVVSRERGCHSPAAGTGAQGGIKGGGSAASLAGPLWFPVPFTHDSSFTLVSQTPEVQNPPAQLGPDGLHRPPLTGTEENLGDKVRPLVQRDLRSSWWILDNNAIDATVEQLIDALIQVWEETPQERSSWINLIISTCEEACGSGPEWVYDLAFLTLDCNCNFNWMISFIICGYKNAVVTRMDHMWSGRTGTMNNTRTGPRSLEINRLKYLERNLKPAVSTFDFSLSSQLNP